MRDNLLAYAFCLACAVFFFWVNQDGNILISILAAGFVLQNVRVRLVSAHGEADDRDDRMRRGPG